MGEPFFKPTPENTPIPESEDVIMDGNANLISNEDMEIIETLYGVPFTEMAHRILGAAEYSRILEKTDARQAFIDAIKQKFQEQRPSDIQRATEEWLAKYGGNEDLDESQVRFRKENPIDPDLDPEDILKGMTPKED